MKAFLQISRDRIQGGAGIFGGKHKMIDKFLDCMKNRGWTVETNKEQKFCLPEPMKSRYTGYPESWVEFVSTVKV